MAGVESQIYENDVELPEYSEKPYTSLHENIQQPATRNPVVQPQRDIKPSPGLVQSRWIKCYAAALAAAVLILIILVCVTIAVVVTKVNCSDEARTPQDNNNVTPQGSDASNNNVSPLTLPEVMPANCREIKYKDPDAKSGNYLIRIDGRGAILLVYCDHETSDGGWTLVYSYGFTNYESFKSGTNSVTPRPNWDASSANIEPSTKTPSREDERGAMDFSYWRAMGTEFLVKSNIVNWIRCSPSGGSLSEWKAGEVTCKMVKVIQDCPTGNKLPVRLVLPNCGPFLSGSHTADDFAYYWEGSTECWPVHDPCGKTSENQKTLVQNPYGAIYFR